MKMKMEDLKCTPLSPPPIFFISIAFLLPSPTHLTNIIALFITQFLSLSTISNLPSK